MSESLRFWLIFLVSIVIALALTLFPWTGWGQWLRPIWVPLVVFYWTQEYPERVGLFSAWVIGLWLDIVQKSLLGEHALALLWAVYLSHYLSLRILSLFWLRILLRSLILLTLYFFVIYLIQGIIT